MPPDAPYDSIDRREALRRAALLLGGAVSAPALAGVLAGCRAADAPRGAWSPRALTAEQAAAVATIAEHIVPETDTPGARAAGVDRFIDTMLAEYYGPDERARFVDGLTDVDARARRSYGRAFLRCSRDEQVALLTALDREAFATPARPARPDPDRATQRGVATTPPADTSRAAAPAPHAPPPFFRTMKELTLLGYYTSEPGATRELRYARVPGRFEGCVPLARVGRAWAV